MSSVKVNETMTRFPEVAFPGTTVEKAKAAMEKWGIRHLPVVDKNKVIGIVSERDLIAQNNAKPLRDLMSTNVYQVHQDQYLVRVIAEMAEKKYGCAIVVDESNEIVGIFTTIDALNLLCRLLGKHDHSKIKMLHLAWNSPDYMI
ncbi:MAG: hypothetical protein A4S09_03680 [Proteobacteria bacterium SG_bin7]|nr:MAG: hypothetical protein A4S09_03680 [Proteobacteria bacterium SG_bin7]